jgi:hypothetical protein
LYKLQISVIYNISINTKRLSFLEEETNMLTRRQKAVLKRRINKVLRKVFRFICGELVPGLLAAIVIWLSIFFPADLGDYHRYKERNPEATESFLEYIFPGWYNNESNM